MRGRDALCGIVLLAGAVGCASSGSSVQSVPIITDPSGATAVAGGQRITTPGSLLVPAGARELEIRIDLPGYQSETVLLLPADSSSFTECFDHAVSDSPKTSAPAEGGHAQGAGSGLAAIVLEAAKAAAGCSSETDVLVPTFVFRKLIPLSLPPIPVRESAVWR